LSDPLKKLKDFMDTEEGKSDIKKYFDEIREKEDIELKKNLDFFESDGFFLALDNIKNWMISNSIYTLSDDDFNYGYHFKYSTKQRIKIPITEKDFHSVFNAISTLGSEKSDDTIPFSNGYTDYNEWRIVWISGQGVINRLTLDISRLRNKHIDICLK